MPPARASRRPRGRPRHPGVLTPAEWRIVEGIRHGLGLSELARRLGISRDAVKYHVRNSLAKLQLSSRAALRRWQGVRADSALARRRPDMTTADTPLIQSLGQVSRTVRDLDAAHRFFAGALGLPHLFTFGELAFYDLGHGTRLYLTRGEPKEGESILYFRVADIGQAVARLAERGVPATHAPHRLHVHADGSEEWMAFVADPEGRPVGLMAMVRPG